MRKSKLMSTITATDSSSTLVNRSIWINLHLIRNSSSDGTVTGMYVQVSVAKGVLTTILWTQFFLHVSYRTIVRPDPVYGADTSLELPQFLDSPEQALLTVPLFTNISPGGGGTMIAPESVGIIARYLADHPEGVMPRDFPFAKIRDQCTHFVELTGEIGDVRPRPSPFPKKRQAFQIELSLLQLLLPI